LLASFPYRYCYRGGLLVDNNVNPGSIHSLVTIEANKFTSFWQVWCRCQLIDRMSTLGFSLEYSSDSNASMIIFQKPCFSHRLIRVFAVESSSYSLGSLLHGMPVLRINRMCLVSSCHLPSAFPPWREAAEDVQ